MLARADSADPRAVGDESALTLACGLRFDRSKNCLLAGFPQQSEYLKMARRLRHARQCLAEMREVMEEINAS